MKNALILAGLVGAGYVVYRVTRPPVAGAGAGTSGGKPSIGNLLDGLLSGVKNVRSSGNAIVDAIRGEAEDSAGWGYSTRADARGQRYARQGSAVTYGNDSTYSQTLIGAA